MKSYLFALAFLICSISCSKENQSKGQAALNVKNLKISDIKSFLVEGRDINSSVDDSSNTLLLIAISQGKEEIIDFLLDKGADTKTVNIYGVNALHASITFNNFKLFQKLIKNGADVNYKQSGGFALLHKAVKKDKSNYLKVLLQQKAINVDIITDSGMTPLMLASRLNRKESAELLIKSKANISLRDSEGKNALDYARKAKAKDTIQLLNIDE